MHCFIDPNPFDMTGRPVLEQPYFFYVDLIAINELDVQNEWEENTQHTHISFGHKPQDYGVSALGSINT